MYCNAILKFIKVNCHLLVLLSFVWTSPFIVAKSITVFGQKM